MGSKLTKDSVSFTSGMLDTLCSQGFSSSFRSDRGWVDRVMKPPSTIVVPQMVIGVGLIHSDGQLLDIGCRGLCHGAYLGWYALCSNNQIGNIRTERRFRFIGGTAHPGR